LLLFLFLHPPRRPIERFSDRSRQLPFTLAIQYNNHFGSVGIVLDPDAGCLA
jgi:hypothetical protein